MKPELKVVEKIHESNFRDIPKTLRQIADNIDDGVYGNVGEMAVCLMGDKFEVFGLGPMSDGSSTLAMMSAGVMRLTKAIEEHGR